MRYRVTTPESLDLAPVVDCADPHPSLSHPSPRWQLQEGELLFQVGDYADCVYVVVQVRVVTEN